MATSAAKMIEGVPGVCRSLSTIEMRPQDVMRFWSNVRRGAPDECWHWIGSVGANGYGKMGMRRRYYTASRLAWFLANGEQPVGYVCHSCDNRRCVNPAHLWLGDASSNAWDSVAKGRHWRAAARVAK